MTFSISNDHKAVRTTATLTRATTGTGTSKIQLFSSVQPATGAAAGVAPLVEILLTNAVGAVDAAGVLALTQANVAGDLIATNGTVVWGRWLARNGALLGDGDVSDETGTGFFKLAGTTGTVIYAGARAILGATAIG